MKLYRSGKGMRKNEEVFIIQKSITIIYFTIWVDYLVTDDPSSHYDEIERLFKKGDYVLTGYKDI